MPRRNRREEPLPLARGRSVQIEPIDAWQLLAAVIATQGRFHLLEDLLLHPIEGSIVAFRNELSKTVTLRFVRADEDFALREEFGDATIEWRAPIGTYDSPVEPRRKAVTAAQVTKYLSRRINLG